MCERYGLYNFGGVKKKYLTPLFFCSNIVKATNEPESLQVMDMEKIFEQALLYDFYGELLTEHQRSIYEDAVYNDMSLGEIAEQEGISRQGVHDLIKRCDRILQAYEAKLHLVDRFERAKAQIKEIERLTDTDLRLVKGESVPLTVEERMNRIRELSEQLLEEL